MTTTSMNSLNLSAVDEDDKILSLNESKQGQSSTGTADDTYNSIQELKAEEELRIELPAAATASSSTGSGNEFTIQLLSGTAEMNGSELMLNKVYHMELDTKFPIFTWHGCRIQLSGVQPKVVYTSSETPMVSYINTHAALQTIRQNAADAIKQAGVVAPMGAKAIIVGANDSGKSTLARILLNYAVRAGHHPIYVDLDPGNNLITIPGTLGATVIDQPINIQHGDLQPQIKNPITYFYGHSTTSTAAEIYSKQIEKLASVIRQRMQQNDVSRISGCIIKMSGNVEKSSAGGYEQIIHAANTFHADVILVIGHERLYSDLNNDRRLTRTKVAKLTKSGGVVSTDQIQRRLQRNAQFRQYFYGLHNELAPHTKVLHFRDVEIYRVGGGPAAPTSALPIGGKRLIDPNKLVRLFPSTECLHSIMGVVHTGADVDSLSTCNVAGFVYCSAVDMTKKTLHLLSPAPGNLPSKFLLYGTLKWLDLT